MSKVTCKWTKEKIEKNESFSVVLPNHKKHTYFKSEKKYNTYIKEENAKENIQYEFNRIMNKGKYSKLSRLIKNKIKIWTEEGYLYQEIEYTIYHNFELLNSLKIKGEPYLVQVISNKLLEGKETFVKKEQQKGKKIKIELDIDVEDLINNYEYKKTGCDITRWI